MGGDGHGGDEELPADESDQDRSREAAERARSLILVSDTQRDAGRQEQQSGQDDRQESSRHPEVLRLHANLVEEENREGRERKKERRFAPESLPGEPGEAGD